MTVRGRLAAGFLSLAVGCAALPGCTTGLPDRTEQVQRLKAEIPALPGVAKFDADYVNDFEAGASLRLSVYVPEATEPQVVAIAQRITDITRGQFGGYRQETAFAVAGRAEVQTGAEPDPPQVADRVRRLRQMISAIPTAEITWSDGGLSLRDAPEAAASFAAVRGGLAGEPARVKVMPRGAGPMWEVDFPFDAEQERRLAGQVAAFPFDVRSVALEKGFPSTLIVGVRDPKTAYADLTAVISTFHPTREHPLRLMWHSSGRTSGGLEFAGSVHVSGCQYVPDAGEQEPGKYYTPEAIELQRRLRAEFDACR